MTADAGSAMSPDQPIARGIAMVCLSMAMYGVMDAASKWLAAGYHPTQILLFRAVIVCCLVVYLARTRGGWAILATRQPKLQVFRSCVAVGSMMAMLLALRKLPLAETVAIVYSAPVLVTLLSIPVLGEKVGMRRTVACGVGFCGMLLIARPGSAVFQPAALYAAVSMVLYALASVLTRRLGRTDRGVTTLTYTQFAFLAVCVPSQVVFWVTPTPWDLVLFVAVGAAGAIAQFLLAAAYTSSPASVLAPFDFTAMIWAAVFGVAIWGQFPDSFALTGMSVVMAAGAYIALREVKVSPPRNLGSVYLFMRRPFR